MSGSGDMMDCDRTFHGLFCAYKKLVSKFGWMILQQTLNCSEDEITYKNEQFLHYIKTLTHISKKMESLLKKQSALAQTTEYYDLQNISIHLKKFIVHAANILGVVLNKNGDCVIINNQGNEQIGGANKKKVSKKTSKKKISKTASRKKN